MEPPGGRRRRRRWCCGPLAVSLLCAAGPRLAAAGSAGDLYCGRDDCYGLLGLDRDATPAEIKKSYRKLALKWHPDKNKSPEAVEKFRKLSRAHEVLSEEKLRRAYDYYLDHPEAGYAHYYKYYEAVYAPQTPLWIVVTGILTFLSGLQYLNQHWKYSSMMRCIRYQPSFKRRVNELLEAEVAAQKGKLNKTEKELLKERLENHVFDSEVQLSGGGFAKPSVRTLVGIKAVLLPIAIATGTYEALRWHWRFSIKGEAYGEPERAYLTRRALGIAEAAWDTQMDEAQRKELMGRELWRSEQLLAYAKEKEEEFKEKRAQSGAYKRARRWMKNH